MDQDNGKPDNYFSTENVKQRYAKQMLELERFQKEREKKDRYWYKWRIATMVYAVLLMMMIVIPFPTMIFFPQYANMLNYIYILISCSGIILLLATLFLLKTRTVKFELFRWAVIAFNLFQIFSSIHTINSGISYYELAMNWLRKVL